MVWYGMVWYGMVWYGLVSPPGAKARRVASGMAPIRRWVALGRVGYFYPVLIACRPATDLVASP